MIDDAGGREWLLRGSSVVWDAEALSRAAGRGVTVSLRQALAWETTTPAEPPTTDRVIVVSGLTTALDVLGQPGRDALLGRIARLVRTVGRRWGETAIVFACAEARPRLRVGDDELTFSTQDGVVVPLGRRLWGGNAAEAIRLAAAEGGRAPIGCWVRRVS
jgi:hypothetical protein